MASTIYVGRGTKVYCKPLPDGIEIEPVAFTATLAGLYSQPVTIDTGATSGTYGLTIGGVTVTATATAAIDTPAEIAKALVDAVNASTTFPAKAGNLSGATFYIYHPTTFTLAEGGTQTANMSLGVISSAADQAHGKGLTKIWLASALPTGALISRGEYLPFKAPGIGGAIFLIQADEQIESTGSTTAIKVDPLVTSFEAGSTATAPYLLGGRTNASLNRQGNRVTSVTFDDDAFERGLTTTKLAAMNLAGNWTPNDAGYRNAEYFYWGDPSKEVEAKLQMYFWLEMPNTNQLLFSKGRVYKGPGSITSMPLEIPADGIITGSIEAAFNGRPTVVNEVPR